MSMQNNTFDFHPVGNVKITYDWSPETSEFNDGTKQFRRRRIHAKKTYSFKVVGTKDKIKELVDFYNGHHGQLDPFIFRYDGKDEMCYFASALSLKYTTVVRDIQGFSADVTLEVDKQLTKYPTPSEDDVLPNSWGPLSQEYDWKTSLHTVVATQRRLKNKKPVNKVTATIQGLKSTRDVVIRLFNSHEKVPLKFFFNGKMHKVRLPDSMQIEDIRSLQKIVGFKTTLDMEILD